MTNSKAASFEVHAPPFGVFVYSFNKCSIYVAKFVTTAPSNASHNTWTRLHAALRRVCALEPSKSKRIYSSGFSVNNSSSNALKE